MPSTPESTGTPDPFSYITGWSLEDQFAYLSAADQCISYVSASHRQDNLPFLNTLYCSKQLVKMLEILERNTQNLPEHPTVILEKFCTFLGIKFELLPQNERWEKTERGTAPIFLIASSMKQRLDMLGLKITEQRQATIVHDQQTKSRRLI